MNNLEDLSIEELRVLWREKFEELHKTQQELQEHAKTMPRLGEEYFKSEEFKIHSEIATKINRLSGELIRIGDLIGRKKLKGLSN